MPATVTNKALNTGSVTNKEIVLETKGLTFEQTRPATFGETQGTLGTPWSIRNKSLNTGSITNKAIS